MTSNDVPLAVPQCPVPTGAEERSRLNTLQVTAEIIFCVNTCHLVKGFIASCRYPEVDHGILERPAHVVLQGKVVDPLESKQGVSVERGRPQVQSSNQSLHPITYCKR